jgi:hypothetical protein
MLDSNKNEWRSAAHCYETLIPFCSMYLGNLNKEVILNDIFVISGNESEPGIGLCGWL